MSSSDSSCSRPLLPAPPAQHPTPPPPRRAILPRQPRIGVSVACDSCRKRKVRCNGSRPRCANCVQSDMACTYAIPIRDHELRRRVRHLETEQEPNRRIIELLQSRSQEEASLILRLLREGVSIHGILRQVEHGDMLTLGILRDAEEGNYGVLAAICYNIEHLTAMVRAAESKRSPLILLLFPSTLKQLPTLAWAASAAIKSATVPLALHLDHAQDTVQIEEVACTFPFDSIMVDMSHHEHRENLSWTKDVAKWCHDNDKAVEAECGRINGGEDGIADTGDLEALLTTPEEVEDFLKADIDILASSVGNIHGDYGPKGPEIDLDRLSAISKQIKGRAQLALHGTNDFTPEIMQDCIAAGAVKLNCQQVTTPSVACSSARERTSAFDATY
ncbi:unnamed protein product [Fusarium equiseti]|uniref:Fructose-bisphosphate aldolase n=1 Tax=Fusarium equiseti TaxID=61235 RepID=A0A8J2IUU9_FUSEQ|nr:unnamed protein product [Fusarium equiseti]